MASSEESGAKRQMFYDIECVIEDCDNEAGYKPLSDSDEVDDLAEEDEPREEDIDSSEEWEPLRHSKLKRHASSSPSSSLPRRRGRPPKNALKNCPIAPATSKTQNVPITPITMPALPRRRGRPPKDKAKTKLMPKACPYPTIVPKPPPFATLIPNTSANAQAIKFASNSASTITFGHNFSPIALSSTTSPIKLSSNSTPILIPNAVSAFKLSPNSGSTSASVATLICTPTPTSILPNQTVTVKEEKVDPEKLKFKKKEILERSDSPDIKRQRLSSSFPQDSVAQGRGGPSETTGATSDNSFSSQPTTELSFESEHTTMDDQLTSILASEPTPILNHKFTSDPSSNPPINAQEDSDFNSELDEDSDEISDSEREDELWEDDVDSVEDWNLPLESPERSQSPALTALSQRGKDKSTSPSAPQGKPNTVTSPQGTPTTPSFPQAKSPTPSSPPDKTPIYTSDFASEAIPTPTSEATPTISHKSTHETTSISIPVSPLRRRRGRPRKNLLNSTLTLNPSPETTPTPILSPTLAVNSTPITSSNQFVDPTLSSVSAPNPTSSTILEANSKPASIAEAIPQPSSNEDNLKPAASSCSPRKTKCRSSSQPDLPWTKIGNMAEKWLNVGDEDEQPELPNFVPKRPPGLQLLKNLKFTPLQLFQLFFANSTIKTIVQNTNRNAEKRAKAGKKFPWVPLTIAEFYSYLAVIVYMSLVKAKSIVDYWARKRLYNFSYPQSIITRARFLAITCNLQFCDPKEDEDNNQMKGTKGYDRLLKIKPLCTDILSACRKHFHPKREITIDERIVASKAKILPQKLVSGAPEKWGYKLFVLIDSSCGYTCNFFVYEGKSLMSTGKGIGYDSVMRLTDHNYLGRGYRLYTDIVYTSPSLFLDLLQKNILACGHLRRTLSLPKVNDLNRKSKRGSIRWCRQGPLLFVKWMDAREVLMCSTIHKAFTGDTVNRKTKDDSGTWITRPNSVPSAVNDYSKHMGVVDLSDSLMEHYSVLNKTTKWYKSIFYHFIDIAVVNSYILHQQLAKAQKKTPLTPKLFRETLVSELTRASRGRNPPESAARDDPAPSSPVEMNSDSPSEVSSPPASTVQTEQCLPEYFGSDATSGRKVCVMCKLHGNKAKTPIYCSRCKVALCFVSSRNCFKKWHNDGHL